MYLLKPSFHLTQRKDTAFILAFWLLRRLRVHCIRPTRCVLACVRFMRRLRQKVRLACAALDGKQASAVFAALKVV